MEEPQVSEPQAKRFLLPGEAAGEARIAPGTLANWRTRGTGPPYIRIGGRVLYDREALFGWLTAKTRTSTTETVDDVGTP